MAGIDLNADLGETVDGVPTADDDAMFAVVSSASIACGGHAGDAASMRDAVSRAARHGVAVGAHPSFVDRAGFGRTALAVAPETLREQVRAQLDALIDVVESEAGELQYVKPHGALYHAASADAAVAAALAAAVADASARVGRPLPILGLPGEVAAAADAAGLPFRSEAFLDRGYLAGGGLVPRGAPGALLDDADVVAARAVRLALHGEVEAVDGRTVRTDAVSLCLHGDSPGAVAMARAVRRALEAASVEVRAAW